MKVRGRPGSEKTRSSQISHSNFPVKLERAQSHEEKIRVRIVERLGEET